MTHCWNVANTHCSNGGRDAGCDLEAECMRAARGDWREAWVWNLGLWHYWKMVEWVCLRIHTIEENAEALIVASKEIGLEVNVDKAKYMVVCWDQKAGRGHSMKIDITSFEMVEELRYLGTTLTNQSLFWKKLTALWSQGMLAIIRCRMFCIQFSIQKSED